MSSPARRLAQNRILRKAFYSVPPLSRRLDKHPSTNEAVQDSWTALSFRSRVFETFIAHPFAGPVHVGPQRPSREPFVPRRAPPPPPPESLAASIEWLPDTLPTLDYLHESGYRVALVDDSSFPLGTSWEQRISPWIDVVISTRETRHAAPHPAVFQELLTRLSLLPKHVLHVGDQLLPDVFGANGVGLRTALLERLPRDPPDPRAVDWLPPGPQPF